MAKALEFSLAYLTVIGTHPLRMVEIASAAGYDYVGMRFNAVAEDEVAFPLLTDPPLVRDFKSRLDATGLKVLDAELIRVGPDDDPDDYQHFMDVATEIGARHLIVQLPDPDRNRAADHLARLSELAEQYGMTADLEFIPWTPTCDLAAAADIVNRAAHPSAGILVDTLHFDRSESSVSQLRVVSPGLFRLVQFCDAPREAPRSNEGLIRAARAGRSLPGEGGIDLRPLVEALPRVPYSLEVPNEVMRNDLGDEEFAKRVLEASRRFFAATEDHVPESSR
jgi:sugar phosphate isomerase/epimerase